MLASICCPYLFDKVQTFFVSVCFALFGYLIKPVVYAQLTFNALSEASSVRLLSSPADGETVTLLKRRILDES